MSLRRFVSLSLAAAALLVPTLASASSARLAGLAVPGDYVQDDAGRFTYLSATATQGGLVWASPSASDNNAMGAVLPNLWGGRAGTFAVNLRRFAPALGQELYLDPAATSELGSPDVNTAGESLDLTWARRSGDRSLALRVQRSFVSRSTVAGTTEGDGNNGRNVMGYGVGYGFPLRGHDAEVSFQYQTRDFKGTNLNTPSSAHSNRGGTWLLAGRTFVKAGPSLTVVPAVRAYSFGRGFTNAAGQEFKSILSGWQAGVAGNWTLGSNDLFVLGAQLASNRNDLLTTGANVVRTESLMPNVFVALETQANAWLRLRFGARNTVTYNVKDVPGGPPSTPQTLKRDTFLYNMGATVKVGTLTFDGVLTPNFFDGAAGNVLNGVGGPTFSQVSVTYAF
jgi:hypothetical protein